MDSKREFKKKVLTRPKNFMYSDDRLDFVVWGLTPFSVNRDSDILNQSNFKVISEDLMKRFPKSVDILKSSHFLCGWFDQLMVKTTSRAAFQAVYDWDVKPDDYPVASDDDYSDMQYEEACNAWDNWASYDVKKLIEEKEIPFLIDEDGDYNATEEQEEVIKCVVTTHILDNDRIIDDVFIRELLKEFKSLTEDTQTLTLDL